nr:glycosyltransferase family 2 protein [uncultured Holophaga sp.]
MNGVLQVSAVLPNYNGAGLLQENLPSVLEALRAWGGSWELIVVDDASTDGSVELLRQVFPEVRVVVNECNLGFPGTCNRGFSLAEAPIVLCINTDVRVDPEAIAPLLAPFEDGDVFAVVPNVLVEREGINQGVLTSGFRKGFVKARFWKLGNPSARREIIYAVGACVAYRADRLRVLGGYSELYAPYLFEDFDLSYRAWKRGWSSVYEPASTVHHFSNGTLSREKKRKRRIIYFRNRFIFHWSNLTDPDLVLANLFHTALRLALSWLWLDTAYYASFWSAFRGLGAIRRLRGTARAHLRLSDREVLRRTGDAH